ncbi:MAG: hypothetical protein N3G21_04850, partial [Candidatus Hydrogenedentes bacterium]|nr:hypothetical protein [Candidatus Hydrogenedentota bacterium]
MKSCISVFRSRNNLTFKTVVFIVLTILPSYGFKAEAQPIPIGNVNDLQKIGNDPNYPLNGSYILIDDIDATGTNQWNSGQGFQPIGSQTNPFSGEFDGNGKKIIGLYINRTAQNVGLFSVTSSTAKIKNLTMATSSVASPGFGGVNLGAIVGTNNGLIENCHVISSSINATIGVGGICGANNATGILRRCVSSAYVSATLSSAGGLVGGNSGTIEESSSSGNVSAINSSCL